MRWQLRGLRDGPDEPLLRDPWRPRRSPWPLRLRVHAALRRPLRGEKAALSGAFVALVGVLFSAYLSYLELFVLRAICQWCVASAVLVVAYLVLGILRLLNTGPDEDPCITRF